MTSYIAAGANRHPAAADWFGDVLAYGSDRNIALWNPQSQGYGVTTLLAGHTDTVNAVKFLHSENGLCIISGSVDKTIRIWYAEGVAARKCGVPTNMTCVQVLIEHQSSINCIAVMSGSAVFATGAADATVKIWEVNLSGKNQNLVSLIQSIDVKPRFFPLALALSPLYRTERSYILAVAGTSATVQLYVADLSAEKHLQFVLRASLSGHEGWIRSLSFINESDDQDCDLLLSSASQDKYIRLWRVHKGKDLPKAAAAGSDPALGAFLPGKPLSNKAHRFNAGDQEFSATFEALLLGHEDWIYSTLWKNTGKTIRLLSASADNSLAIWEQDPSSGVWVTVTRLGEISAQKGSTTATGSTGGFWTGLWSPNGETVACIGRTGSWRLWNYDGQQDRWVQGVAISGHTKTVTGISWSKAGDYLLSTSSDQTTRLHAKWKRGGLATWHEMARPQIHGYDLSCIDTIGDSGFVSGAEEKLLRVFSEPKAVADLLQTVCGIEGVHIHFMPDAANMPVLGLSNKAIEALDDNQELENSNEADHDATDPASIVHKSTLIMDHPPFEDHLSRHTLWPEIEKLYGHGYEISAVAASHDGSIVATACRASSVDQAVIRLFETKTWTEIKPPLTAHSLTVTRVRFSADDRLLLSVGRDRQLAIFVRNRPDKPNVYTQSRLNAKAHSRMILDAAMAPTGTVPDLRVFATAGRDKVVKLWKCPVNQGGGPGPGSAELTNTISADSAVTAVDFLNISESNITFLAVGTESGRISVWLCNILTGETVKEHILDARFCPTTAITQLSWKPSNHKLGDNLWSGDIILAAACEDSSLRIYDLRADLLPLFQAATV